MSIPTMPTADSPSTSSSTTCSPTTRLALPAPPPPPPTAQEEEPLKLDVGTGESVSLYDRLGPTVVNSDGTLSRIVGWSEMGPEERKRILRVLGKRNQIRLEAKKQQLEEEERGGQSK